MCVCTIKLGNLLCKRMQHAKQYFEVAKGDLETLKQSSPGSLSYIIIRTYTVAYIIM